MDPHFHHSPTGLEFFRKFGGEDTRWQHRYIEQTLAVLRNGDSDAQVYRPDGDNRSASYRRSALGSA